VTTFDHLFAVVLLLVLPAMSAWDVPRLAQRIAADPLNARTNAYFWNMAILWGLTTVLIAAWGWAGRPVRELGLQLPDSAAGWWWTLLICCAVIGLIVQQAHAFATSPDAQAQVRKQFELQPGVQTVLPSTPREFRVYSGAAVTAGVCEEVLYRGYLLWYFQSLVPGGVAIAGAVVAFGVAHAYQGMRGIFATGTVGAFAVAVYLLTGSLVAPILLHAILDLVNGFTIYRASRVSAATGDL
jgi:membrane protease YdiL (CAAX protease family)